MIQSIKKHGAIGYAPLLQFHNNMPPTMGRYFFCDSLRTIAFFVPKSKIKKICEPQKRQKERSFMAFFNSAVGVLQTLVIALGAGLGIWGVINLLEGYGNDNPGAKSQGMKQLMAGGGVALIGATLVPLLSGLFG